jgi:hypothetical protein
MVLRPTIVYGDSYSHCGSLFDLASQSTSELATKADPDAIMHSLDVDDCGDADIAFSEQPPMGGNVRLLANFRQWVSSAKILCPHRPE